MPKTIVIVGGVAGGASAAARARRLSEEANIIMLERGPYVSFANCGLPYHIGGVIKEWDALQVQTPESLKARFNLDVRVLHEATRIDRQNKRLQVRDLKNQRDYSLDYDYLILSPGAEAFKPPIPGIDSPNVFTLKTIPDMDRIIDWMNQHPVKHATVVGAGFIGIETAENFRHRGLAVTLIEREKQVMPPMDPEMTALLHQHLRFNGVDLRLGSTVTGISATGQRLGIQFDSGTPLETDLVVLSIGVRPESKLAKEAGLALNERGAIKVNEVMETSDPAILAVGDAIEVSDFVTETQVMMPLAGPANRQGRIAASKIFGEDIPYRGTTGTWVVKVFDLTAAQTGPSEKTLNRLGKAYAKVYLHPSSHAGYYPGAAPMAFKLLYDPQNGRVLGAQIVGTDGVDKRTDVIATAVAAKMTVSDLHHLELCYAPPYGSAKDPVNLAGMIADNLMKGSHQGLTPDQLQDLKPNSYVLIDVRTALEHEAGHIPGSQHIPVDELRNRLGELPKDKEIILYCQVGLRGYVANRMLTQKGIKNRNLVGGYKTWAMFHEERLSSSIPAQISTKESFCSSSSTSPIAEGEAFELDVCGLQCPGPLLKMRERMEELKPGQVLKIVATDPGFPPDAASWAKSSGNKLLKAFPDKGRFTVLMEKTAEALSPAVACRTQPMAKAEKALTMVVFSADLDRAYAVFIIANGAAAMGMKVTLFFTFWGLNILRKREAPAVPKTALEQMFGMMMPKGPEALGLSKMHFAGMGTMMMKHVMAQKQVEPLPDLIAKARQAGVRMVACSMSMDVMGIKHEELIDGIEIGGVASYIGSASDAEINLFV